MLFNFLKERFTGGGGEGFISGGSGVIPPALIRPYSLILNWCVVGVRILHIGYFEYGTWLFHNQSCYIFIVICLSVRIELTGLLRVLTNNLLFRPTRKWVKLYLLKM